MVSARFKKRDINMIQLFGTILLLLILSNVMLIIIESDKFVNIFVKLVKLVSSMVSILFSLSLLPVIVLTCPLLIYSKYKNRRTNANL